MRTMTFKATGLLEDFLRRVLKMLYGVQVKGAENYAKAGERVLIVANHVSFLDAVLLALFLPEKPAFAIAVDWSRHPLIRFFASTYELFPMDPHNPLAVKSLIAKLKENKKIVIFPEGRLTATGRLMKIYEGSGLIAARSGAKVLPVHIKGAEKTFFSRVRHFAGVRFPKIELTVYPAQDLEVPEGVSQEVRRRIISRRIYDIMLQTSFDAMDSRTSLTQRLIKAQKIHGRKHQIINDVNETRMNYGQLVTAATVLGRRMAKDTAEGETVGILLPSLSATVLTFFALHFYNRVPAMLNFSAGHNTVLAACKLGKIKTVYTSKRFIRNAKLEDMAERLAKKVNLVYLEDLRKDISRKDKLAGAIAARLRPGALATRRPPSPDAPAVVLFTSGSESKPKAVVLSHTNVASNCNQVYSMIDFTTQDKLLSVLPMFHSFGLTMGTIMPILRGVPTFFYPTPLHFHIIPEVAYGINATLMLGTDTFLNHYARHAHNYDFFKMRHVFAGGEKLKDDTRRLWQEKFGLRILEGYGATECSPVIAVNTPMENRIGTVGRFLPGIEWHLEPVEGIEDGGRLVVRGPNVMLGYMPDGRTRKLKAPSHEKMGDGWYDTGDIVGVDDDGFVRILDRAKRFAKIGGERVSLGAVEALVKQAWPDDDHAVIAMPDPAKGERLVLLTTRQKPTRTPLLDVARSEGVAALQVPRSMMSVQEIPRLATGKADYGRLKEMAEKI